MRTLSTALEAAQQKDSVSPLVKIVLTSGAETATYEEDVIKSIEHTEKPYSCRASVVLDNSDGTFTDLDYKGYQGVISYGAIGADGEEYSATAPLWVLEQKLFTAPGDMSCQLDLVGIPDLMAEDRASEDYKPTTSDTETVKDLIDAIAGATLTCFSHCTAIDVDWDDEDDLVDDFQPQDGFAVFVNETRLAKIKRLLDYTGLVAVWGNDGDIHIVEPTTSGTTYDYEYALDSGHTFFSKAYRQKLVIPNYVVVQSRDDDDDQYTGYAKDTTSNDLLPMRQYFKMRLQSNTEAGNVATAKLSKYQLWSDYGSADVPMNVGAELYDYVNVAAFTGDDTARTGNIGFITRHYKPGKYWMKFGFGSNFQEQIRALNNQITTYGDEITNIYDEVWVEQLFAEYIEATYILAGQIDVGHLSALTARMGILTSGEIRIGTGDLDDNDGNATGGSTTTLVDSGATWTPDEHIDKVVRITADPYIYENPVTGVETTCIYPYYEVVITDNDETSLTFSAIGEAVASGDYYAIGYGTFTGFRIWTQSNLGRCAGISSGTIQFYVGSDGKLYAGDGAVILDSTGVTILGQFLFIKNSSGTLRGYMYGTDTDFVILGASGIPILLQASLFKLIGSPLRPNTDAGVDLGDASYQFGKGFFKNRLKIPVGTDKYD